MKSRLGLVYSDWPSVLFPGRASGPDRFELLHLVLGLEKESWKTGVKWIE